MSQSLEPESKRSCPDFVGSSEGKLSAEELFRIVGQLIALHDQERNRIGDELHDKIGAALATVGIEVLALGESASSSSSERQTGIQAIYEELQETGARVSQLSHELVSSVLKHFGLAKAVEVECRKFSNHWHIPVACSCPPTSPRLDPVLQLNFFKVLQAALHNAGRHSRATKVAVSLSIGPTELTLELSDDGIGFDPEQVSLRGGLGLIILATRIRLVGGRLELRSQPGQGTRIVCRAPLASSESQPGGAGA